MDRRSDNGARFDEGPDVPRTLVCFRRAAAGRACGEHQTAPAAPAKVVANDAQTGLKGLELKNAAADAKSGDDVSAALKARRSK